MYLKDKEQRVTIRLTNEQLGFIDRLALGWGVSRSNILRVIIDTYRKGENNENKQANIDN